MAHIIGNIIELVVFKVEENKPSYLLLHRTKNEEIYPDVWQFITGSIERNEKTIDAVLRELSEETSLKPLSVWSVPHLLSFFNKKDDAMVICPFFAAEVGPESKIALSDEHNDFGWFEIEDAIRKLIWPGWKDGLRIVHDYIIPKQKSADLSRLV